MSSDKEGTSINSTPLVYSTLDRIVQDFASRGLLILAPEDLGIAPDVHERVYKKEKRAHDAKEPVTPASIPDVLEILNAPGVVDVCNQLVGENWAIVPFTHNASFTSGARDQHWHKDDNGPYNGKKQRHHQAVQIEMLYYPQAVNAEMGPTATVPYSHYWSFDSEENQDNFAGAEHLDFNYQIDGMEREPISGPDSKYEIEDIVARCTAHDIRMRDAVTNTGWPLVKQLEAAPLRAGSIVFYSHNTFHRGNHRRDDWHTWPHNPRFMWRFWIYRTTEPKPTSVPVEINWNDLGIDPLTQIDLSSTSDDVTTLWRYHNHWMHTGAPPPPRPQAAALSSTEREAEATRLFEQLHATGEGAEPTRMGAAYKLASVGDTPLAIRHLSRALYTERESVRRAATHGLIALGQEATDSFIEATHSPIKWVRKAGVYGLGDASQLSAAVLQAVAARRREDPPVFVRSVAAGALGCLGRRAAATGIGAELIAQGLDALIESLAREENRLSMDRVQGRSIKFVRPTDECDICEGNGIDFGLQRFKPVRSAVRENALWSIVILSSHGTAILDTALESTLQALHDVFANDENAICVGFAMDALNRLAHLHSQGEETKPLVRGLQETLRATLKTLPIRGWEALVRGGLSPQAVAEFE
ncbi:MAG: phytanoyl-CoA dioxygenase family protein [Candidatus Latescibacterota bacterium]